MSRMWKHMLIACTTLGVLVSALLVTLGRLKAQEMAQAVDVPAVEVVQVAAQLAQAEANQGKTQLDVDRYIPLAKAQAISAQDLDNAVQNNLAAKAQVAAAKAGIAVAKAAIVAAKAVVEAAKAQVATATLTLGFTTIQSPIEGIAGIATAQVGDLVGPNSGTLTTVSTLDPIKVYFTASAQAYLNFVRRNPTAAERLTATKRLELELVLAAGTTHPHKSPFFV